MKKLLNAILCIGVIFWVLLGAVGCRQTVGETPEAYDYTFLFSSLGTEASDTFYEGVCQLKKEEKEKGGGVSIFELGNSLMLDSVAYATKTHSSFEIMHAAGYSGVALDTFDFTSESVLNSLQAEKKLPVLTGNLLAPDGTLLFPNAYQIIEDGGKRMGIFGVIDPAIREELPENLRGDIMFIDTREYVEGVLEKFGEEGVDVVVLLTSSRSDKFLKSVLEYGKIHFVVDAGRTGEDVTIEDTLVSAAGRGNAVKRIRLEYNPSRTAFRLKTEEVTVTASPENTVSAVRKQVALQASEQMNASLKNLPALSGSQTEESPMGKLLTLALEYETGAEIAVLPAAYAPVDIEENDYSLTKLFSALPMNRRVRTVKVAGKDIVGFFQTGNRSYNFSGITYREGECKVNQIPIVLDREYTVAYCEGCSHPFSTGTRDTPVGFVADALVSYFEGVSEEGIMAFLEESTFLA